MTSQTILLVKDNPGDEALTLRAFEKSNIRNEVVVLRDGAEALAYLFPGDGAPRPDILDSDRSGANTYVRKPVRFSDFADAVRTLSGFWLRLMNPRPAAGRNRIKVGQP